MKPIAVIYATREGQSRRIAERAADDLRKRGFQVVVQDVRDFRRRGTIDLSQYCAVILAASVHFHRYEREMVRFVKRHRVELDRLPTAFLSVSLSEAGVERPSSTVEQRAALATEVKKVIDRFFEGTGWRPAHVQPVAGALQYSKYNPLLRFAMSRIAKIVGVDSDASRDFEYTDWAALDQFADALAEEILSCAGASITN